MIAYCPLDALDINENRAYVFFLLTFLLVSNATNVSVLRKWFLGSPRWEGHNEVLLRQQLLWSHLNLSVPLPVKMINSCWPRQLCHQDCRWFNQWVKLPFCYIRSSCVVNFLPQTLPKCPDTLIVPTAEILVLLPRWTFHFPREEAWKKDRGQFDPDPSPCSQPRHETIWTAIQGLIPCCSSQKQYTCIEIVEATVCHQWLRNSLRSLGKSFRHQYL